MGLSAPLRLARSGCVVGRRTANALAVSASHPAKVGHQSAAGPTAARYLQFPICVGGVGRRPRLCLQWPINGLAKYTVVGLGESAMTAQQGTPQPISAHPSAAGIEHSKRIGHDQVTNVCTILSSPRLWVPNSDQRPSRSYELMAGSPVDQSRV